MEWKQETANVGASTVGYQVAGDGLPLVLLPGLEGPGVTLEFASQLARDFYVVMPDLPGFGKTPRPEWVESVRDVGYFLLDFLESANIQRPRLVGASLGGWIASELAVDYGRDLEALVLLAPLGLARDDGPYPDIFRLSPAALAEWLVGPGDLAQALSQRWLDDMPGFLQDREMTARLAWSPRLYQPKLGERLGRIVCPTLVVVGKDDKILGPRVGLDFVRRLRRGGLQEVPEGPHALAAGQAQKTADVVRGFLLALS